MNQTIGIALLICSACILLIGILQCLIPRKPLYKRKMPPMTGRKGFYTAMMVAYKASGNIKSMLLILKTRKIGRKTKKRVLAALDYLDNSRYRDYENTLQYLNDESDEAARTIQQILELEIRKLSGLECKQKNDDRQKQMT